MLKESEYYRPKFVFVFIFVSLKKVYMKCPTKDDVEKLGLVYRLLAAFILFCGVITMPALLYALLTEPIHPLLFILAILIFILLHASFRITFSGFAPNYLLFAHGPKRK